jgi:spore maturation protein CgeB
MACGALVISNWGADPFPFGEEHLVRADPDSIAATISYYLRHESERRSVAETARRHVTRRLMWRTWVDSVLRRCLAQREGRNGVGV